MWVHSLHAESTTRTRTHSTHTKKVCSEMGDMKKKKELDFHPALRRRFHLVCHRGHRLAAGIVAAVFALVGRSTCGRLPLLDLHRRPCSGWLRQHRVVVVALAPGDRRYFFAAARGSDNGVHGDHLRHRRRTRTRATGVGAVHTVSDWSIACVATFERDHLQHTWVERASRHIGNAEVAHRRFRVGLSLDRSRAGRRKVRSLSLRRRSRVALRRVGSITIFFDGSCRTRRARTRRRVRLAACVGRRGGALAIPLASATLESRSGRQEGCRGRRHGRCR